MEGSLAAGLAKNWALGTPIRREIGPRGNRKAHCGTALAPRMQPRHMLGQARFAGKAGAARSHAMPQTNSRFFDDLSRLMTDAAGLADGAKREAQTFARSQIERMMAGMNVVAREEFEAVKEMAARARDENEKLAARVAALEAKLSEPRP
jgi:BMFP domain-containing protein YqiC